MKLIKVCSIQYEPIKKKKSENIKNLVDLVEEASYNNSKLIVLPEMSTTGYVWQDREEIEAYVEKIPGETTALLSNITKKYNNYIVIGMAEKDEKDIYYNSAVLIGPEGYIGKYRKIHSFISDPMWARDGNLDIPVFDTEIGKIGLCICMDLNIPETTKLMHRKSCDIICSPCNWTREKVPSSIWFQRAFESKAHLIISNRWGEEKGIKFTGGSCVINSEGRLENIIASDKNGLVYSELKIKENKIKLPKYYFYKELLIQPYTWNPIWFYKQFDNELPEGSKFKASTVQTNREKFININNIKEFIKKEIEKEVKNGSNLIVLPKNILNPYINNKIKLLTEKEIFKIFDEIKALLKKDTVVVLSGTIQEKEQKKTRAYILNSEKILFTYNQIYYNKKANKDVRKLDYLDTKYGRIGIIFGNESINFEFSRVLTIKGIDLLLILDDDGSDYNNYDEKRNILWNAAKSRSRENNIFAIYSNYCDKSNNIGYSGIFGPNSFFKESDFKFIQYEEKTVSMNIDTSEKSIKFPQNDIKYKPFMHSRKIEFYDELV